MVAQLIRVALYENGEEEDYPDCDPCSLKGNEGVKARYIVRLLEYPVDLCDDCFEIMLKPTSPIHHRKATKYWHTRCAPEECSEI